jgi:hypothetical protein
VPAPLPALRQGGCGLGNTRRDASVPPGRGGPVPEELPEAVNGLECRKSPEEARMDTRLLPPPHPFTGAAAGEGGRHGVPRRRSPYPSGALRGTGIPRRGIAGKPASANKLGQPKHSAHGTDAVGGVMGESDSHFIFAHFPLLLHPVDSQEILKQEVSPGRLCVHIDARPGREGPGISLYMARCLTLP